MPKTVILDINPEQVDWCLVDAREAFDEEREKGAYAYSPLFAEESYSPSTPAGKVGLWILKPSLGDKAAGITILNGLKKLKEAVLKDRDLVYPSFAHG